MSAQMITSGTTALATTADAAVDAITAANLGPARRHVLIVNEGPVAGFFSIDGGTTWGRLPAEFAWVLDLAEHSGGIQIKRVASGADLSGVYVSAW